MWRLTRDGVIEPQPYPDRTFAEAARRGMMRALPESTFEVIQLREISHGAVPCRECGDQKCRECQDEPAETDHCPVCGEHQIGSTK